jgi:hypothetical protein
MVEEIHGNSIITWYHEGFTAAQISEIFPRYSLSFIEDTIEVWA